jgi:ABC-2 type transport system permease protein
MRELVELWRFREVLFNLVRRNLKVRYKNSFLGFFWSLLNPLMQIGVWWLVFKVIMNMPQKDYTAELITGFLPWLFFSQCVLDSTACVTQEMALVKKAYFPRVILPLSALVSNLIHLCLAFVVALVLFVVWRVDVNLQYWLVIPSTLLVAVFAYGLSAMLAAWSVFYSDVKFIVGNLLGLWFFLTPVLYPLHLVLHRQGVAPTSWLKWLINGLLPHIKQIYLLDPVAISMLGYRSGLLRGGQNPILVTADIKPGMSPEEVAVAQHAAATLQANLRAEYPLSHYIIGAALIALLTAIVGHLIFRRLSRSFPERG